MAVPLLAAWFLVPCLAIALVVGPQSHSEGEQASFFTSIEHCSVAEFFLEWFVQLGRLILHMAESNENKARLLCSYFPCLSWDTGR